MNIRMPKAEGTVIPGDPFVYCQMTGFKCRYSDTVVQWDGRRVLKDWADLPPVKMKLKKYPNEMKPFYKTGYTAPTRDIDDPVANISTNYPLDSFVSKDFDN